MEANACKKYQKRDAGNDTREAFGCFSLRAFFGALTVFSVSLSGVFAAVIFILVCVDRCFFAVCVRSCFFIRTVSSYRLTCNRCQNILPATAARTSSLADRISLLTVVTFWLNLLSPLLLVRTKLSTTSSVSASLGTV